MSLHAAQWFHLLEVLLGLLHKLLEAHPFKGATYVASDEGKQE